METMNRPEIRLLRERLGKDWIVWNGKMKVTFRTRRLAREYARKCRFLQWKHHIKDNPYFPPESKHEQT